MNRFYYALTLFILLSSAALAQVAGAGRSFVVTLPHVAQANTYLTPAPRLLLTSESGADVQLLYTSTGLTATLNVPARSSEEVLLDSAVIMLPEQEGTFLNTIQISSSTPVTAQLLLDRSFASEAYAAIPDSLLGFDYLAISSEESEYGGFINVIGIHDDTRVTIVPTRPTRGGLPAGQPIVITLNRGQVYQLLSDRFVDVDLTNTEITSTKPVGVLSGSACADINQGFEHRCNPLVEQLPHTGAWGRNFVAGPLHRQSLGVFRIIASCNNTTVKLDGRSLATMERGTFVQVLLDTVYQIIADKPVMVAQLVTSTSTGLQDRSVAYGDPSLTILPPRELWGRNYSMLVPSLGPRQDAGLPVGWRHFVSVMMPEAAEATLRINGLPPTWIRRLVRGGSVVGIQEVGIGNNIVESPVPVGVIAHGYSVSDAYGYTPASHERGYESLRGFDISVITCRDSIDTLLALSNPSSAGVVVDAITFTGGISGEILPPRTFPITIPAGEGRAIPVRLRNISARADGWILLRGGCSSAPLLAIKVTAERNALVMQPAGGGTVDFGRAGIITPVVDRTVTLRNNGQTPLLVEQPVINDPVFTLVSPGFPLVIPPGESVQVVLRFAPQANGTWEGRIDLTTSGCPDPQSLTLKGERRNGGFLVGAAPSPLRLLCGPKIDDTLELTVANDGDSIIQLNGTAIDGIDAGEFQILTTLAGRSLAPGERLQVQVRYRPGGIGLRDAGLRIDSDATNPGGLRIPFDVRNDTVLLEATLDTVALGRLAACDSGRVQVGIINRGTIPLGTLNGRFALEDNGRVLATLAGPLPPGDTTQITVELQAGPEGTVADMVQVSVPECGYVMEIPVRAERLRSSLAFARDTLDFGVLPYCLDSAGLRLALRNDGGVPEAITLEHTPAGALRLETSSIPGTLLPADSVLLAIHFTPPPGGGIFIDSVRIVAQPCGLVRTLVIRGVADPARPALAGGAIDFGTVGVGTIREGTLWLVNRSSSEYRLSPPALAGDLAGVRVLSPAADTIISPGDSVAVVLEYRPTVIGDSISGSGALPLLLPCGDTLTFAVAGVAEEDRTRITLRWEDATGEPGGEALLRLHLEQGPEAITDDTLRLRTSLRFNASMLVPVELIASSGLTATMADNRMEGKERVVTMEMTGLFPASGALADLRVRVALGNDDETPLAIDGAGIARLRTAASVPLADTLDGTFKTLGICRVGADRLIDAAGFFRILPVQPNPVREGATVRFETIEDGMVRLALYDARGVEVLPLFSDHVAAGTYQAVIDLPLLPAGVYWLALESATQTARQRIVVLR